MEEFGINEDQLCETLYPEELLEGNRKHSKDEIFGICSVVQSAPAVRVQVRVQVRGSPLRSWGTLQLSSIIGS